jgi:uncharacterized protein with HEPN domain
MYNKDNILIRRMLQIIDRISDYIKDFDNPDSFASDHKTFDATLMNFVALGETVGKLSEQFRKKHKDIDWRQIYAFRNIIAHDYFGVDEEEVFEIINKHLPKLKVNLLQLITEYEEQN